MADRQTLRDHAREMRHEPTPSERLLWGMLRRRPNGLKFRRQVPLGDYIVDFACLYPKIIVECDGGQHADSVYDAGRDDWLRAQGFEVLRFWNNDVVENVEAVVDAILRVSRRGR